MYTWKVMHLCDRQLRDINHKDILNNGLYRKCDTYKGGGGYDKFSNIYKIRTGQDSNYNEQFVVQLKGCPLRCPYCYVTVDGVHNGTYSLISTEQLVKDFNNSKLPVFHLMGGAPALYINYWKEILERLDKQTVFHSDLLLVEGEYPKDIIENLASYKNSLYAVSIKGYNAAEFRKNTNVELNEGLFWRNFDMIVDCGLPFYLTYTGMTKQSIESIKEIIIKRYGTEQILDDSFSIDIIKYEALK